MGKLVGFVFTLLVIALVVIGAMIFFDVDVKDDVEGTEVEVHVPDVEFGSKEVNVTVPTIDVKPNKNLDDVDDDIVEPES